MRLVGLFAGLFVFWLMLSGLFSPLLIALGVVACLLATAAAWRLNILDREAQPLELLRGAVTYWPWLIKEIIKSAWSVTKVVLHPQLPISPTMTVVKASQKTPSGIATYANSITLTPGTLTTGVSGRNLTIHALVKDGALDLESGGMDRRVSHFEGSA